MISLINGVVRSISPERTVVEVGGVGLAVSITSHTSSQLNLGTPIQLFTSLVVREDSLTLFGFLDEESCI
jgi:Holliday junction DNA helicase RuvA